MMFSKSVANSSSVFRMSGVSYLVVFLASHLLLGSSPQEEKGSSPKCQPFHCGMLGLVSFPFFNETYPECGFLRIDDCTEQVSTLKSPSIHLGKDWPRLSVKSLSQDYKVRLHGQPEYLWSGFSNPSFQPEFLKPSGNNRSCDEFFKNLTLPSSYSTFFKISQSLFNCSHSRNLKNFGTPALCNDSKHYILNENGPLNLPSNCSPIWFRMKRTQKGVTFLNLFTRMFELQVTEECLLCRNRGGKCQVHNEKFHCLNELLGQDGEDGKLGLKLGLGLAVSAAASAILIVLAISCWRKLSQHNAMVFWQKNTRDFQIIETFLRNHGSLAPKRYSYSDIKKMTNSFKHKLGQGGHGAVYKGKSRDGCCVAVKVLTESKGNSEKFINEVASITRTSHVNIVTLLGFCFEGRKRALIYEFMSNGSLEKFIHEKGLLKWETMYQIVVGIARGLEYLHRGCNTRILHFDIKPHNILLNEDFCPKISDFSLTKICPKKESIVSMTSARGTIGYIAPKVFSKNFGLVSHKSNVYSFGMMVLKIVGGRQNNNVQVDNSSESYFPQWIYKRLEVDELLGLHGISNEEDEESVRKMIIVSLWCIQSNPSERPTISKVVEMLEGSIHSLQIPPTPLLSLSRSARRDSSISIPSQVEDNNIGDI